MVPTTNLLKLALNTSRCKKQAGIAIMMMLLKLGFNKQQIHQLNLTMKVNLLMVWPPSMRNFDRNGDTAMESKCRKNLSNK